MTKTAYSANTIIEYSKAGDQMKCNVNNRQAFVNVSLPNQENNERHDKSVSTVLNFRTMTIEDTTVRLSFNDSGDLNTRLANAFQTMLGS
jgi:hypothetical protein